MGLNEFAKPATKAASENGVTADIFSWWVANGGTDTKGAAYTGTLCHTPYNTNIVAMQDNELISAFVRINKLFSLR